MSPEQLQPTTYDLFLSYSHRDDDWVKNMLLPRLEDAGLTVCTDDRCFQAGAVLVSEMARAIETSRHTLAVLTPDFLAEDWPALANALTQAPDGSDPQRRLVGLMLEPCDLPDEIAGCTVVDLSSPDADETVWHALLSALSTGTDEAESEAVSAEQSQSGASRGRVWIGIAIAVLLLALLVVALWGIWRGGGGGRTSPSEAIGVATLIPIYTPQGPSISRHSAPPVDADGALVLLGRVEPGASVEVLVDGLPHGSADVDAGGMWTYDLTFDTPGEYEIAASALLSDVHLPMVGEAALVIVPTITPTPTSTETPLSTAMPTLLSTHTPAPAPLLAHPAIVDRLIPSTTVAGPVAISGIGEPGARVELIVDSHLSETTSVIDDEGFWSIMIDLAPGTHAIAVQAWLGEVLLSAADEPATIVVLPPTSTDGPAVATDLEAQTQPEAVLPTPTAASTPDQPVMPAANATTIAEFMSSFILLPTSTPTP